MIGRCEVTRGDLRVKEVLKGTGEGLEQMKRIQRERKKRNTGGKRTGGGEEGREDRRNRHRKEEKRLKDSKTIPKKEQ